MQSDTYAALKTLLTRERESLRNGDFASLKDHAKQKEEFLYDGVEAFMSQQELRDVRQGLQANQALLIAAIRGVQSARARLAALEAVRTSLGIYDQNGKKPAPVPGGPAFNRKV